VAMAGLSRLVRCRIRLVPANQKERWHSALRRIPRQVNLHVLKRSGVSSGAREAPRQEVA
jgi:hypothetical protein